MEQARIASLDVILKSAFRNFKSAILASPLRLAYSALCSLLGALRLTRNRH